MWVRTAALVWTSGSVLGCTDARVSIVGAAEIGVWVVRRCHYGVSELDHEAAAGAAGLQEPVGLRGLLGGERAGHAEGHLTALGQHP